LIPDPSFDGPLVEWERPHEMSRAGKTTPEGRNMRHSLADALTPGSKSRSQRGSTSQKLQALPNGYPQARASTGPPILKRADGQLVKLVCIDCQRENFASIQGFINHCRIAHRRDYKSHEEAAVKSGQPIELDEAGSIIGEERSPSIATGLVHPRIRSAPTDREAYAALLSRIDASMNLYHQGKLPGVTSIPGSAVNTPNRSRQHVVAGVTPSTNQDFVPSDATPHLSDLMRRRGFGGNLNELVGEAKKVVDIEDFSSHEEDSENEKQPEAQQRTQANQYRRPGVFGGLDGVSDSPTAMRMPARSVVSPAPYGRPSSSKGPSPRLSYATPINTAAALNHNKPTAHIIGHNPPSDEDADTEMMILEDPSSMIDLSPNTVASNNAPSLVSDDGEYDEADDVESEIHGSDREDEDSDVAEIDIEDGEGVEKVVPRTALRHRTGSGGEGTGRVRLRKEDKHVSFVSPVKEKKERKARN